MNLQIGINLARSHKTTSIIWNKTEFIYGIIWEVINYNTIKFLRVKYKIVQVQEKSRQPGSVDRQLSIVFSHFKVFDCFYCQLLSDGHNNIRDSSQSRSKQVSLGLTQQPTIFNCPLPLP